MYKFQLCRGAIVILIWNGFSALATVYNSDGSLINVQSIHDTLAQNGDTITLPAGAFDWVSTLTISKGITLVGLTTTDPVNRTANDRTIIRVFTGTNGNTPLMKLNAENSRASGITFRTGQTTVINSNGMIQVNASTSRLDNCHFDDLAFENNNVASWGGGGVIDHNLFDFRTARTQAIFFANPGNSFWGDEPWTQPANFGGADFCFVEDNCINNASGSEFGGGIDGRQGAKWVFRRNHVYNGNIGSHGTEIGRYRGGRAGEVYNNDFHWTISPSAIGGIRSGGFISHDNTHDGVRPQRGMSLGQYRVFIKIPSYGGSPGDNVWDVNVTEPDGTHIDGHPPYLFDSSTAQTGSNQTTIVDSTKNWISNRWIGYTAKRVSDNGLMLITGNTNNTLTGYYHAGYGGGVTWNAGDQYEIHKVLVSMDQPCRGQGDLIIGDFNNPINARTGRAEWTRQALEPAYSWNDVYTPTGAHLGLFGATGAFVILQGGRDYFNDTPMPGYTPFIYPHPLVTDPPIPSPTPSATVTPSPTTTPTPTPSAAPSPTPTSTPAATPTATPTPIATATATSTATPTPTPTSTPAATPTPTSTPTATPTATATPRHTPRPHPSHGPVKGTKNPLVERL